MVDIVEVMASLSTNFGSGVRGGAVCVLLESEGVMSQMKTNESHDRTAIAGLREAAEQEEALIEQLEETTRALWRARKAKHQVSEQSLDLGGGETERSSARAQRTVNGP